MIWNPTPNMKIPEIPELRPRNPDERTDLEPPEEDFGARRNRFGDDGLVPPSSLSQLDWTRESVLKCTAYDSYSYVRSRRVFTICNG